MTGKRRLAQALVVLGFLLLLVEVKLGISDSALLIPLAVLLILIGSFFWLGCIEKGEM
ncbi:MAG: hypothetical protein ACLFTQ_00175 [Candidatus Aenigmatarchaeota archaeon]